MSVELELHTVAWHIPAEQVECACEALSAAMFVRQLTPQAHDGAALVTCSFEAESQEQADQRLRILKHELLYADVEFEQIQVS